MSTSDFGSISASVPGSDGAAASEGEPVNFHGGTLSKEAREAS